MTIKPYSAMTAPRAAARSAATSEPETTPKSRWTNDIWTPVTCVGVGATALGAAAWLGASALGGTGQVVGAALGGSLVMGAAGAALGAKFGHSSMENVFSGAAAGGAVGALGGAAVGALSGAPLLSGLGGAVVGAGAGFILACRLSQ